MTTIQPTPSKIAAAQLATLDVKEKTKQDNKDNTTPSLLSKMQQVAGSNASTMEATKKPERHATRATESIVMDSGETITHAAITLERKYVGDLSITDDSQEPLLQESEQRFVLFPIQYQDVSYDNVILSHYPAFCLAAVLASSMPDGLAHLDFSTRQ